MERNIRNILQYAMVFILLLAACAAQSKPLYLDPSQPIDARVDDLIKRMTLEQKASQVVNQARAIPELQVPGYDWWSEALHGVANAGTATVFPEPIGLAATFDDPLIHQMAIVIGTEARAKHELAVRPDGATSWRAWISGRRTSISFAIRAGDAGRRLTAKIRFSPDAWALRL